jgi:hypothetical protein
VQLARGLDNVAKKAAVGLRHWLAAGGSTGTNPRARRSPRG